MTPWPPPCLAPDGRFNESAIEDNTRHPARKDKNATVAQKRHSL
jgi:hypothetical protein